MTTTSVSDPLIGNVLDGRYEVLQRLARGGMATVYRALDTRLHRIVAIKVMHEGLGDDHDFAGKFDREARAAAKLSHPNVVSVFDRGFDFGRPYIVMEFVRGSTMRALISRQAPLDPLRCLQLIDNVLAALTAAHENNLVHRDIKPENILISDRGQVKVADFGLARAITAQTATATQGMLIGTVSYLPPELVVHGTADTRSDVYSTGVVLFEMLTGSKPHTGETPIQVAYAHVHNEIPAPSTRLAVSWKTSRSGIPPYLDALVRAATQRDPERRPEDARAFLAMVRKALAALSQGVMDDPALTKEFSQGFADLENTEGFVPELTPDSASESAPESRALVSRALHASERIPVSPTHPSRVGVPSQLTNESPDEFPEPTSLPIVVRSSTGSTPDPRPGRTIAAPARRTNASLPAVPPRRRRILPVLVVLLLIGAVATGGWWLAEGRFQPTPDVVGWTVPEAERVATEQGLTISTAEDFSETVPAEQIISTDPGAGADVVRGGTVHVVVSVGPERFDMPEVIGITSEEAVRALTAQNLKVGDINQAWSEEQAEGLVIEASVAPGTKLRRGDSVDLVISKGREPISINNYTGWSASEARKGLEKAGFDVSISDQHHSTVPEGRVISQDPKQGTGFRGDKVSLVRSLGPVMVKIPDVKGLPVQEATDRLTQQGFKVETKPSANFLNLGFVASTEPGPDQTVPEGSTITLLLV